MNESNKLFYKITAGVVATAGAIVGLAAICYNPLPKSKEIQAPLKPEEIQIYEIEPTITDAPNFDGALQISENFDFFDLLNQQGEHIEIKDLLKKSIAGDKAKEYVEDLAEEAYETRKEEEYASLETKIDLAKDVMMEARNFLQVTESGGEGNYTAGYEYSEEREIWKEELLESDTPKEIKQTQFQILINADFGTDSTQTFDEFYGPKDGRILAGDCDDFSIALTTVYHGLKDYAEANKGRDKFFKALAEGLDHYKILSVFISGHALNLGITLKDKPEFEMMDLSDQHLPGQAIEYTLEFKEGKARIVGTYEEFAIMLPEGEYQSISISTIEPIIQIFNRDFSASDLYLVQE